MVRRRKPSGASAKQGGGSKRPGPNRKDAKIKRWERPEDIPQDEEDLFHAARDKILLDGSDVNRNEGFEELDNEEEVFALKGLDDSDDGGDFHDDDDDDDEEDEDEASEGEEVTEPIHVKKKGKAAKTKAVEADEGSASEEEEEERWGKNKSAYYSSAANEIESDDEEARALEEAEALRLQAKARDLIAEEDFGLDELLDVAGDVVTPDIEEAVTEDPQPVVPVGPQDKRSVLRYLEKNSPETLALMREWEDIVYDLSRIQNAIKEISAVDAEDASLGMIHLHHQTLLAYATTLAFYLHVRATPVPGPTPNAPTTSHAVPAKVLERLFQLKQNLSILEDLGFSALDDGSDEDDDGEDEGSDSGSDVPGYSRHRLSQGEVQRLLAELELGKEEDSAKNDQRVKRMKQAKAKMTSAEPSKVKDKSKKASKSKDSKPASKAPVFDLEEPEFVPSKPTKSSTATHHVELSSFGDPTELDFADAADKSARRRSLRFHTSRIENTSRRRENARAAMGGDDDIPWRDVRKEKQRAKDLALKEGRGQGGDDLDPEAPEDPPGDSASSTSKKGKKRAREEDAMDEGHDDAEGDDGYYDLVKKRKKELKEDKKAAYEAERRANQPDFSEDGSGGPRSLTRAILKNRGMTPKRSKTVRNPRVKKKERYEKAKKQMGSKRAVFKGGLASLPGGRYEGEKTGISTVVKSVKL